MNEERAPEYGGYGSEPSTPLQYLERIIASLPPGDPTRSELIDLRSNFAEQEEIIAEARHTIEKLDEVIKKVTSPANRIGTYLGSPNKETAQIVVGAPDYYCNVDPRINISRLKKATRVLVNEAYVIVGDIGYEQSGPVTKVTELIGPDRLRVGTDHGVQSEIRVLNRSKSDELPPDSLLQAQVEAFRILHIDVPLSAKRQFQLFCSEHFPASTISSTASLPISSGLCSLCESSSPFVTNLLPKAPPSALAASVVVTSSSYSMIVPQVSCRTPMGQASFQRLAQSSPAFPGKRSAWP
jgi:Proteasomal ATPase OB N-terminal domain